MMRRAYGRARGVLLLVVTAALAGGLLWRGRVLATVAESTYQKVEMLQQVVSLVSERYVEAVAPDELILRAARGLLRTLDPHSVLLEPDDYRDLLVDTKGQFGGIGIELGMRNDVLTVVAPLEGTPAFDLGIQGGDRIVEVEGELTKGWTIQQAIKRLRGPRGTQVQIGIEREGVAERLHFTIRRDIIRVKSVPYSFLLTPEVGYVRLSTFAETSGAQVAEAIEKLRGEGAQGILLDLRHNPGGLLNQAVGVSEVFLDKGQLIVSTRGRMESQNAEYRASRSNKDRYPLVLLINGASASASEIVAGAIQDHDRGLLVGTPSFGKGSVQTLFTLEGGYALKLTTALYYTPSGRSIHRAEGEGDGEEVRAESEGEGEPGGEGQEKVEKGEEYHTEAQRVVYGGGGITPDVIVEPPTLSEAGRRLVQQPLFFNYGVRYHSAHRTIPQDFTVTQEILDDFRREVAAGGITMTDEEFAAEIPFVRMRLLYEITRAYWGEGESRRRIAPEDVEIQKALELIARGKTLEGLFRVAQAEGKAREAEEGEAPSRP